jgi:hypothetical protein
MFFNHKPLSLYQLIVFNLVKVKALDNFALLNQNFFAFGSVFTDNTGISNYY